MKNRPAGVTVIAILAFVLGGISLLWSLLVLGVAGLGSLFGGMIGAEALAAFGASTGLSAFVGVLGGIVQIVVGFGLLGMYRWAWYLALIGVGLNVVSGLISLFTGGIWGLICGGLTLILPVIILIYLFMPGVRRAFKI